MFNFVAVGGILYSFCIMSTLTTKKRSKVVRIWG